MAKEFEVRFFPDRSFDEYLSFLISKGGKVIKDYSFTDHIFRGDDRDFWDLRRRILRIREWKRPVTYSEVLFTAMTSELGVKATIFEGKVKLFQGDFTTCIKLLEEMGFKEWFSVVKRRGHLVEMPEKFVLALEEIDGVGVVGELEFHVDDPGEARNLISKALKVIEIDEGMTTHKSMPLIAAEHLGLLSDG